MIRVAIVEDHQDELEGIVRDLANEPDIEVVGTASTLQEARTVLPAVNPEIVITDLVLPDGTGSALIVEQRAHLPNAHFLVLSAYEDYDRIYAAILAGAVGYLGKVYVHGDLAQAVREVHSGGSPMSSPIARKVLQAFHAMVKPKMPIGRLTDREQEVLHILATGRSYRDIAEALCVSVETVRTHIRNIYRKLHIHSVSELKDSDMFRVNTKQ